MTEVGEEGNRQFSHAEDSLINYVDSHLSRKGNMFPLSLSVDCA